MLKLLCYRSNLSLNLAKRPSSISAPGSTCRRRLITAGPEEEISSHWLDTEAAAMNTSFRSVPAFPLPTDKGHWRLPHNGWRIIALATSGSWRIGSVKDVTARGSFNNTRRLQDSVLVPDVHEWQICLAPFFIPPHGRLKDIANWRGFPMMTRLDVPEDRCGDFQSVHAQGDRGKHHLAALSRSSYCVWVPPDTFATLRASLPHAALLEKMWPRFIDPFWPIPILREWAWANTIGLHLKVQCELFFKV